MNKPTDISAGRTSAADIAVSCAAREKTIVCIIPALNEREAISLVIGAIPAWVDRIIVADNGSTDGTGDVARACGATVVDAPERGYGSACLRGLEAATDADIVVFLDGDNSDEPSDMADIVGPVLFDDVDMVIGSRAIGNVERGALTPQQRFGNWLATRLIHAIWGARFTDLGPFRAIKRSALDDLHMADRTYGWTVEMQVKAVERGLSFREVPVRYKQRIGVSKVSGTVRGSILAGYKILGLIGWHALCKGRARLGGVHAAVAPGRSTSLSEPERVN